MVGCGRKVGEFNCCTIVCGDSRELLPRVPDGYITMTITDPPYGIGLEYDGYSDTLANLQSLIQSVIPQVLRISPLTMLTPGVSQITFYPRPTWILCWYYKAGHFRSPWGFNCWQPILCYGKDGFLKKGMGARSDVIELLEPSPKSIHPCPKPAKLWREIIRRGLAVLPPSKIIRILDPFSGSGTTALAARSLGLHFICFEQSQKYTDESIRLLDNIPQNMFTDIVLDKDNPLVPNNQQEDL